MVYCSINLSSDYKLMLVILCRQLLMLQFLHTLTVSCVPLFIFKRDESYCGHYPCLVFLHTALYKLHLLPVSGDIWALDSVNPN